MSLYFKEILEELLINHLTTKSDFTVANKFPVGASGEIINFKALEKLNFYIKKQKISNIQSIQVFILDITHNYSNIIFVILIPNIKKILE